MNKPHIWSKEEKEYLKKITLGHHYREIQQLMIKKCKHQFTLDQIKNAINRYKLNTGFNGRFKKGNIPVNKGTKGLTGANKTSFKKGNKPHNYLPIGTEKIKNDGYVWVKINDPNKWKQKHVLIWEKHNGPKPKGSAILFGDGYRYNFDIDNLILVTRKQLLILNRNKLIQNDADLTRTGVVIADIYQKINEKRKV